MSSALPIVALGGIALVASALRRAGRPLAPPACGAWAVPAPVPTDVAERAAEILATGADYGATFLERWGGQLYKFMVETHGPNPQNPRPHKGVGVRVCVGTPVRAGGGT